MTSEHSCIAKFLIKFFLKYKTSSKGNESIEISHAKHKQSWYSADFKNDFFSTDNMI